MASDVSVKISLSKTTGKLGFGVPLLFKCGADKEISYTECYDLENVISAGFTAESDMYKCAAALFKQENRPEKIAVAGTAENNPTEIIKSVAKKGWRQLILVGATSEMALSTIAPYIETTDDKLLFVGITKTEFDTAVTKKLDFDRTIIFVNDGGSEAAAALVGETAGRAAGSFTYKFKTLKGVTAEEYTDEELVAIHDKSAIAYVTKAGDNQTSEGIAASGKYVDIIDSIDYVVQNIAYRNQKVFNNTAKVPFDNRGIALLEAATVAALQDAFNSGIIATLEDGVTPDYSVSFAARSATTEADRESRVYKYGSFRFALAVAIHKIEVEGVVTY